MVTGKCHCGRETTRNYLVTFSPVTWEEKGPLPLSYWVCEDHTLDEAISAAIERKENDGDDRCCGPGICRHCGK